MPVTLGVFETVIQNLNQYGFYGFILPWMLVFGIVYGILAKTKFFDERISAIIAMVLGFFVTAYSGIGAYFVALSGIGATLIGALLVVVLFFALLGFKPEQISGVWGGWNAVLLLAGLALVLIWVAGGSVWTGMQLSSEAWAAIFMIVVIALTLAFVGVGKEK